MAQAERWQEAERIILSIPDERSKAQALTSLGTALAQAERWQEAERIILSISDAESKTQALMRLGTALVQAERWQEAECVILSIPDAGSKARALTSLGIALAQAERWQEAERVILSISERHESLGTQITRDLMVALAQHSKYSLMVNIVQREWLQIANRNTALDLFSLVLSLVSHYPDLGIDFYHSFVWVDTFLQG